jgi:hypothetical protein
MKIKKDADCFKIRIFFAMQTFYCIIKRCLQKRIKEK